MEKVNQRKHIRALFATCACTPDGFGVKEYCLSCAEARANFAVLVPKSVRVHAQETNGDRSCSDVPKGQARHCKVVKA